MTDLPSYRSDDIRQLHTWGRDHLWMQDERACDLLANDSYRIIVKGEGCYIYDIHGNRYIDGNASGFVKSIGHGRPEVAAAISEQLAKLAYTPNCFGQASIPGIHLARKLAELTPGSLSRTFFCGGGGEAVEVALKLARQFQKLRGYERKFKVISRRPEYHGSTYGAMSLGTRTDRNLSMFEPLMPGVLQVDAPHCHRCPWGEPDRGIERCCMLSVTNLQNTIAAEGADTIAALVATPFTMGRSLPPRDYWPQVRRICDENDIVLIADEVTLGFGRLGTWFGMERFGIVPDIMAIGKGLTSGELPVGAAVATKEIADAFDSAESSAGQFRHGVTFGAHPVVMAAALKNIEVIENEGLVQNSDVMGSYMHRRLIEVLQERHPSVEYISGGLGLLATISVVKSRRTGEAYPGGSRGPALKRLEHAVRAKGLSLRVGKNINITPPLTITRELVDEIVEILDQSFSEMEREFPPGT